MSRFPQDKWYCPLKSYLPKTRKEQFKELKRIWLKFLSCLLLDSLENIMRI
jgi:hypothetical protein